MKKCNSYFKFALMLVTILMSAACLLSCGGDDENEFTDDIENQTDSKVHAPIKAEYRVVGANYSKTTKRIWIYCDGDWTASISDFWITLNTKQGHGNNLLVITIDANKSSSAVWRTGYITLRSGTYSYKISISQTSTQTSAVSMTDEEYNSNSSGGSSSSNGTPEIVLADFTEYLRGGKILLKYRINSDYKVSNVVIYGGTSPNPSTKLGTTYIEPHASALYSGMESGNTYYFKCTATNVKGTSSSAVFRYYFAQ